MLRFQILSRTKPATGPSTQSTPAKEKGKQKQMPKLDDLLDMRDYTGAITFLEVMFIADLSRVIILNATHKQ